MSQFLTKGIPLHGEKHCTFYADLRDCISQALFLLPDRYPSARQYRTHIRHIRQSLCKKDHAIPKRIVLNLCFPHRLSFVKQQYSKRE
jgi:hypothetical protein